MYNYHHQTQSVKSQSNAEAISKINAQQNQDSVASMSPPSFEFPIQKKEEQQNEPKPTTRIQSNGKVNEFALRDKSLGIKKFEEKEAETGNIYIPEGTQVVIKNRTTSLKGYYEVILWFHGKYRTGFIHQSAFNDKKENKITPFSGAIFIDDAKHTVHRAKTKVELYLKQYDEWMKEYPAHKKTYQDLKITEEQGLSKFNELILNIQTYIQQYEAGQLVIDERILKKLVYEEAQFSKLVATDRVEAMNQLTQTIFAAHNPIEGNTSTAQTTLVFPLSEDWFKSDKTLEKHYQKKIKNSILNRFAGGSGEGVMVDDELITEIMNLKGFIASHTSKTLRGSKEAKWLLALTKSKLSSYKTFIFLHGNTWNITPKKQHAEGIGLETSFGPVRANPLKTVLTHEINVNTTNFLPADTHVGPEETKTSFDKLKDNKTSTLSNQPEMMDNIYQSESYISVVLLLDYFKKIAANQ